MSYEKLNLYCQRAFGTFAFPTNAQAKLESKEKELNFHNSFLFKSKL